MARESDRMAIDKKWKRKVEADEDQQEIFNAAQNKYIAQVSKTCSPAMFEEFLGLVEEHRAKPMENPYVIPRLEKLFQSHMHQLIPGFDVFLPEGGKIADLASIDQKARRIKSNIEEGLDPESKPAFRDLVLQLNANKIRADEAYKRARVIFKGNSYLLSVFRTLLPVPTYLRRTPEQADRDPIQKNPVSISPNDKRSLRLKPTARNTKKKDTQIIRNRRSLRSKPPRTPSLSSEEDEAPPVKPMDEEASKHYKELMEHVDKLCFHCNLCANQNYPMDDPTVGDSEEYKALCAANLAKDRERLRLLGLYTPDPDSPPQ